MTYKSSPSKNIAFLFSKPSQPDKQDVEIEDTLTDYDSLKCQQIPLKNDILSKYSYVNWCCQILKGVKMPNLNQICNYILPPNVLGIYSEGPSLRPLKLIVPVSFALPNVNNSSKENEAMINTLRSNADSKVGSSPLLAIGAGAKPSAQSYGFSTGMFSHSFNIVLNQTDMNLIKDKTCRLVLRLGWCTNGFYVPMVVKNKKTHYINRALTAEALPRCLNVKVEGKNVDLPQTEFHGGFATKLGKRLKMSIDITNQVLSINRLMFNVIISWLNAPLEDYGEPILNSIFTGNCSPSLVNVLNLPLYQMSLDHYRKADEIINEFKIDTEPGPICYLSKDFISKFDPGPVFALYDFCTPVKHLFTIRDAKLFISSRLSTSQDLSMGFGELVTEDFLPLVLKCPITSLPIKIPVRGHNCEHLNCFCLISYIQTNSKRPRWTCPICSNHLPFRNLRKDLFIEQILNDTSMHEESEIRIDKDLRYWKKSQPRPETTKFTIEKYPELEGLESVISKNVSENMDPKNSSFKGKSAADSNLIVLSDSEEEGDCKDPQPNSSLPLEKQISCPEPNNPPKPIEPAPIIEQQIVDTLQKESSKILSNSTAVANEFLKKNIVNSNNNQQPRIALAPKNTPETGPIPFYNNMFHYSEKMYPCFDSKTNIASKNSNNNTMDTTSSETNTNKVPLNLVKSVSNISEVSQQKVSELMQNIKEQLQQNQPNQDFIDLTADSDDEENKKTSTEETQMPKALEKKATSNSASNQTGSETNSKLNETNPVNQKKNNKITFSTHDKLVDSRCQKNNSIPPLIIRKVNSNEDKPIYSKKSTSNGNASNSDTGSEKEFGLRSRRKAASAAMGLMKDLNDSESENESLTDRQERRSKKYCLPSDSDSSTVDSLPSLSKKKRR